MRKAILVGAVGALLLGTLWAIPSARGKGGSAKGTEIWWYESSGPVHKAIFSTTGSGIVHEWRYEPQNLSLIFKPTWKFPQPDEAGYSLWTYHPHWYRIAPDSPSKKTLDDIFVQYGDYWLHVTTQD